MNGKLSMSTLLDRKKEADNASRELYQIFLALDKDPELGNQLDSLIKSDIRDVLNAADRYLTDYVKIIENLLSTTQVTWPPEANKK